MAGEIRNVFISHIHEDDEGLPRLKDLMARHGMTCRDGSITTGKFNGASNEEYIKYGILAPRIRWASVLVVYISPETKDSDWVNWEIEYAHKEGKRIVGVWAWGEKDCELPDALKKHADAVVGWNGESIIEAINGSSNTMNNNRGIQEGNQSDSGLSGVVILGGLVLGALALSRISKPKQVETEWQGYAFRKPRTGIRYPHNRRRFRGG